VITNDERPILLCYDCTDSARHAIKVAGALFHGRAAVVLYIYNPATIMSTMPEGTTCTDQTLREGALKLVDEGVRIATEAGFDAVPEAAVSSHQGTDRAILDAAAQYNAGLIVLGSRLHSSFPFPPGSVAYGVAQHTFLPILLVPATQFASTDQRDSADAASHPAEHSK
jgi:nucleotide-binding universal stress UspA family protein